MLPRYRVFGRRSDTRFPFGKAQAPPVPTPEAVQRIDRAVQDKQKADARLLEYAGEDTSFAQFGVLNPVRFAPDLTTAIVLQFTVPPGRVLSVDRVQFGLSEPMCYATGQFGWRLAVNGRQIPFHGSQGLASGRNDTLSIPFGGTEPDSWISPVYVQANAVVMVELSEIVLPEPGNPFREYLVAWCWVFGVLKKTTGVL